MTLTRDEWVKLIIGASLTVLGHLFIREWYQADIWYATGGAYISSKCGALSSVALENLGWTTAEDITIAAVFDDPLTDIVASPMGTYFTVADGGIGHKQVIGTIQQIRPADQAYVYFFTEPSSPRFKPGPFIESIKFDGGLGRTGPPTLRIVGILVIFVLGLCVSIWRDQKRRESLHHSLREVIQMGHAAAQAGESEEQLRMRIEAYRQDIHVLRRPKKDGMLLVCAQQAFTGLRQRLTPEGSSTT